MRPQPAARIDGTAAAQSATWASTAPNWRRSSAGSMSATGAGAPPWGWAALTSTVTGPRRSATSATIASRRTRLGEVTADDRMRSRQALGELPSPHRGGEW